MKQLNIGFDNFNKEKLIGLSTILLLLAAYHLVYFNRYFPIQDGWFSVYAHELLGGKMPYRDYYLFVPPLYLLKTAAVINIFGYDFIALRIMGLIERLILATIIFLIYLKFFKVRHCVIITLVAMVFFSNRHIDVINSYLQTCFMFSVLSAYFILNYISSRENSKNFIWAIFSGFFAALSFLTKQTTGLFVLLVIPASILLIYRRRKQVKENLMFFYYYFLGASIPLIFIINWLCFNGAFFDFLNQVFLGGISSKGSLASVFFGFYKRAFLIKYITTFGLIAVVFMAARRRSKAAKHDLFKNYPLLPIYLAGITFCLAVIIPRLYTDTFASIYLCLHYFDVKQILAHCTFYFSFFLSAYYFYKVIIKSNVEIKNIQFMLLSIIFFLIMYSHGLSYTIEEQATLPSFGLMMGFLLSFSTLFNEIKNYLLVVSCFLIISLCATQQYSVPYKWWGWSEPDIRCATVEPTLIYLKGFKLSPCTNDVLTGVTSTIVDNTAESDRIFTYPSIPLFYMLSDRYPNTFAQVHYFDVCPNIYAINDAENILADPPKVIVNLEFPETAYYFHEEFFRNKSLSGQRKLRTAIHKLTTSGKYELKREYRTIAFSYDLEVWVRKE